MLEYIRVMIWLGLDIIVALTLASFAIVVVVGLITLAIQLLILAVKGVVGWFTRER